MLGNYYSQAMDKKWPTTSNLTLALLKVLVNLGGEGSVNELDLGVVQEINLSEDLLTIKRSGNRKEIQYRLAWIRTKAKQNGFITKEDHRIWKITEKGGIFLNSH